MRVHGGNSERFGKAAVPLPNSKRSHTDEYEV
ncbi:hypothetical protein SAMN06272771_2582 [Streptomyces sp. Ag82_O1-12]|uniref:Uncharacterized protein n=1 Tax=Streptomyces luteogriseus TaxID=68233 RepID=A0A7W7DQU7_9ACTN|nr:hypothetical protein [Streptomyces luteogriseus]SMQ16226.1 hypothetical protein SAMN06272771_2582 [Streptomyces sp. Ag82_O1-12]SOD45256.1 hypothetical protein SAMN06272727_2578 [Streptomyces sp. Ag82_G6-1]